MTYREFLDSDLGRWLDERLPPFTTSPPSGGGGPDGRITNGEQADVVHDLLAHLAGQMIAMNQEKQAEVKGFLTWLERHVGAKVDDLSNKTKVKAYHEHGFEALLDVLRQNCRKLQVNPDTRAVQEAVERELNESLAKLTPLKAKIAAADRLIDLIVYRLYGLTEEEVAVVEGIAAP
jgi:hypothetical protein